MVVLLMDFRAEAIRNLTADGDRPRLGRWSR
jgi:hypothetical protein